MTIRNQPLWNTCLVALALAGCDSGSSSDVTCGAGTHLDEGVCLADDTGTPITCATGTTQVGDECVPDGTVICSSGTTYNEGSGTCDPDLTACGAGTVEVAGECVLEDSLLVGDISEGSEPNDFGTGTPTTLTLPKEGQTTSLSGCLSPADLDGDGELDADLDSFYFEITENTLIQIETVGLGGATAGFLLIADDPSLMDDGWARYGGSLVGNRSVTQVFLPGPGGFGLSLTDTRQLLTGYPVGDPSAGSETCWYAEVTVLAMPTPVALTDDFAEDTHGLTPALYTVASSDGLIVDTTLLSASVNAVQSSVSTFVNSYYRASAAAQDGGGFGVAFAPTMASLMSTDEILVVVDTVFNLRLSPTDYELQIDALEPPLDPGNGTPVTFAHLEEIPDNYLMFEGQEGDLVRVVFDTGGSDWDLTLWPPSTTDFAIDFDPFWNPVPDDLIADLCLGCTGTVDAWVRLPESGYYYLRFINMGSGGTPLADGAHYDVAFTRTHATPMTVSVDTPVPGDLTVAGHNYGFFIVDATIAPDWISLGVDVTAGAGYTTSSVHIFHASDSGQLELGEASYLQQLSYFNTNFPVPLEGELTLDDGVPLGVILYPTTEEDVYLFAIGDDAGHDGDETFVLDAATRAYTDLGIVDEANPVDASGESVAATVDALYFFKANPGDLVEITVTPANGFDALLAILDSEEAWTASEDAGGVDSAEIYATFVGADGYVAFSVSGAAGGAGTFDIDITALAPTHLTSTPGLSIPDGGGALDPIVDVTDTVTLAGACTLDYLSVDVDITHPYRGDVVVSLTSPNGTKIQLKEPDLGDSAQDLVGNFPSTLMAFQDPNTLVGEQATGTWTLSVYDDYDDTAGTALDVDGTLNSWGLSYFCQ